MFQGKKWVLQNFAFEEEVTGLRKIPENISNKEIALSFWILGRGNRFEENPSKCFEKNGCFRTLDLRMR